MAKSNPQGKSKKDNNEAVKRCREKKSLKLQQALAEEKILMQEIAAKQENIARLSKEFQSHMKSLPPSVCNNAAIKQIYRKFYKNCVSK